MHLEYEEGFEQGSHSWKGCTQYHQSEHGKSQTASPGLVVMGGDSCSRGHQFESQHLVLDGSL